jgi:hypothetical protein
MPVIGRRLAGAHRNAELRKMTSLDATA